MGNYYFNTTSVSRGKGMSLARRSNYITGLPMRKFHSGDIYSRRRDDVLFVRVFLPLTAPADFYDLQTLVDHAEMAEHRKDARTARDIKGSLPNELHVSELKDIVTEFITHNFVSRKLAVIAAIHAGENQQDPTRNNPHVHMLISTRTLGPEGFSTSKYTELDKRSTLFAWRADWARVQNEAYARHDLITRVDHRSLREKGVEREPLPYLSRADWWREKHGERTEAGDLRRTVIARNAENDRVRQLEHERDI